MYYIYFCELIARLHMVLFTYILIYEGLGLGFKACGLGFKVIDWLGYWLAGYI